MKKTILLPILLFCSCCLYATDSISVTSPAYGSNVQGNTTITISAPNFTQVIVYCWKQGAGYGSNSVVDTLTLNGLGAGSFVFPADQYPHGPITLRISGTSSSNADNCYLQLYNVGGVVWNEGTPAAPAQAAGLSLLYKDDFDSALSIGGDGSNARYYDHKPPYGNEDFSSIPFTSFSSTNNPFSHVGSYLRIRADANKNSTGLISSMFSNKSGFTAHLPCYFECRFIAPNAPGTWPAFWVLSVKDNITSSAEPNDELDIIEAYGGEGTGKPNSGPKYGVAAHAWNQPGAPSQIASDFYATYFPVNMANHGIPSTWYETAHTYGLKITDSVTIYYCDNIEVGRHQTLPLSKTRPFYFMINLATGGGWPVDLSRYNGIADMYVDYVRVYGSLTPVSVTGISVSPDSSTLSAGTNQQITATITPANAWNRTMSWSSSDTNIVKVTANGLATAVANGTATITVTTQDGNHTATSFFRVANDTIPKLNGTVIGTPGSYDGVSTIDKAFDGNVSTYVDNLTTGAWAGLDLGGLHKIGKIKFYPRSGWASRMAGGKFQASNTANFSSGVTDLYTIGDAPPVGWNQVNITDTNSYRYVRYLTPANGYCNVAEIEFYRKASEPPVPVSGISLNLSSAGIKVGNTLQLTAILTPADATNNTVVWSSSNTSAATVSVNGMVTGVSVGTATITATTQDGNRTATASIAVTANTGKLTGAVIGTPGSYDGFSTINKVFDDNISTYADNLTTGAWAGLSLGKQYKINKIRFYPRNGWTARMVGGKFQGANVADFSSGAIDLYTVSSNPSLAWNEVTISNTTAFQYVRYLTPTNGYLNVAEVEFYGDSVTTLGARSSILEARSSNINDNVKNITITYIPVRNIVEITGDVRSVQLFSLQGTPVLPVQKTNYLDISSVRSGIYIVYVTDIHGSVVSQKIMKP